jgi:catechol 2,3-dioxygenase
MPPRSTGLYHFAVLVPTRSDLARSLRRIAEQRYPIQGAADHLVSEAVYLADPDGNGIEIYRDRPREEWPRVAGNIQMATDPLDLYALLGEAEGAPGDGRLPAGTRIGHMHLQIADLAAAERFYVDVLGLDIVVRMPSALFVSAGGYHHHLGLNTWQSRGGSPAPAGSAGLRYFSIRVPDAAELERVTSRLEQAGLSVEQTDGAVVVADPWQNQIRLTVAQD